MAAGGACVPEEDLASYSRGRAGNTGEPAGSSQLPAEGTLVPTPAPVDENGRPPPLLLQSPVDAADSELAPVDPTLDASDASGHARDARSEAPDAPLTPDAAESCGGTSFAGICWYLGAPGASCNQTCSVHGGYSDAATAYVGTADQGGSPEDCAAVLAALGAARPVRTGPRVDGRGLGCHFFGTEDDPWWLVAPSFGADDQLNRARLVCGCAR